MTDLGARTGRDDDHLVSALDASASRMDGGGPWGDGGDEPGEDASRGNPWTQPAKRRRPRLRVPVGQPGLEELIRRSRARLGGGGDRPGAARPIWAYAFAAFLVLWLVTTSVHQIGPDERGVVTRFGRYVETLGPGIGVTLPAPADVVTRVDVDRINSLDVPQSGGPNLLLTADGNLVDLAYSVRWSVRDPERFLFGITDPEETIRIVTESAMRAAVGNLPLGEAVGPARARIEGAVAARVQAALDRDGAGISVQGVTLRRADRPQAAADANQAIATATQQAQADLAEARAGAAQAVATAEGEAQRFNKVYAAYRMAPEVTRKRIYYETVEAVLARNNKVILDAPGVSPLLPMPAARPAQPDDKAQAAPAAPAQGGGQ